MYLLARLGFPDIQRTKALDVHFHTGSDAMNRPYFQRIGQILIHLGATTSRKVSEARLLQIRSEHTTPLGQILTNLGYVSEQDISRAISLQHDLDTNGAVITSDYDTID